ncbi:MAG: hypothetical protein ATN36_02615 [Epulopiscium sp. Nele67-Bin005]|nr:MAG: hypothetical protein ATN36_02615 [Epulopiscium sp. Nele67-Bin005]
MPIGKVQQKDGDFLTVIIEQQELCGNCHACEVVGDKKTCTIQCRDKCGVQQGDFVEIEVASSPFSIANALIYGIPLMGMLIGLGLSYVVVPTSPYIHEFSKIIFSLIGIATGFVILKFKDKKESSEEILPYAKRIVK